MIPLGGRHSALAMKKLYETDDIPGTKGNPAFSSHQAMIFAWMPDEDKLSVRRSESIVNLTRALKSDPKARQLLNNYGLKVIKTVNH